MGVPLRQVLSDFGIGERPPAAEPPRPAVLPPQIEVGDEVDRLVAKARAEGEEAGRAAARAEHERALARERDRAEQHLAAERQRWVEQEGERLAAEFAAALAAVEAAIAEPVARALDPFLREAVRDRMVEALAQSIARLLSAEGGPHLRVRGPADLLDRLKPRLADAAVPIDWQSDGQTEVRVEAGATVIETTIAEWTELLAGLDR